MRGAIVWLVNSQPTQAGLPPLAGPDASEDERSRAVMARFVTRHGAPTLAHYRSVYQACGLDWPGDEEIRRRHPVAVESAA